MPIVYDLETRIELCAENVRQAQSTVERHFFEDRLVYLENLKRHYRAPKL